MPPSLRLKGFQNSKTRRPGRKPAREAMLSPEKKIMQAADAAEWREGLAKEGRSLVLTNGCFDLLHRGHAEYLLDARKRGDALIVLINSDESVRELKGPTRPVCKQHDRAFLLACLSFVDAVCVFDGQRCAKEIAAIKPDIYVKGGDYTIASLNPEERQALIDAGARIEFVPLVEGHSTTKLLEKAAR